MGFSQNPITDDGGTRFQEVLCGNYNMTLRTLDVHDTEMSTQGFTEVSEWVLTFFSLYWIKNVNLLSGQVHLKFGVNYECANSLHSIARQLIDQG